MPHRGPARHPGLRYHHFLGGINLKGLKNLQRDRTMGFLAGFTDFYFRDLALPSIHKSKGYEHRPRTEKRAPSLHR